MGNYGKELIIDLHGCDISKFNRTDIEKYLIQLCDDVIDMERADLHWWDYEDDPEGYKKAPPHLKGVSCVQFITTSTIVIHTLEDMKTAYINIFSCKDFHALDTIIFTKEYFKATKLNETEVIRRKFL